MPRLEAMVRGEEFDPARSQERFRVAMADHAATIPMPTLVAKREEGSGAHSLCKDHEKLLPNRPIKAYPPPKLPRLQSARPCQQHSSMLPAHANTSGVGTDVSGVLARVLAIASVFRRLGILRPFHACGNCSERLPSDKPRRPFDGEPAFVDFKRLVAFGVRSPGFPSFGAELAMEEIH
jgi:hypothetical protein